MRPQFNDIKAKDIISLNGVGKKQLMHPFFLKWQEYFLNEYKIPSNKKLILFLPCAAIKPYPKSPIHKFINKTLEKYDNIQKIVISNAGIIPYEFSDVFPFNSYDWNPLLETREIREIYYNITKKRIYEFLLKILNKKNSNYIFISYLRYNSDSYKALKSSFKELELELHNIPLEGKIEKTKDSDLILILPENLKNLEKRIKKEQKVFKNGILGWRTQQIIHKEN